VHNRANGSNEKSREVTR